MRWSKEGSSSAEGRVWEVGACVTIRRAGGERPSSRGLLRLVSVWGVVVAALLAAAPEAVAQVETFDYTVEEGDTCESIAAEFYEHDGGCDLIKKYNSVEGEGPEFTPGNVLELPTRVAKAEARVDRKHGSVRAREPDRPWHPANVGEELFRTWRVNTLEAARAQLDFRDRSELKMRQNTLVIIYGGSRERAERRRTRARLEEGKLRSKLSQLAGDESYAVGTPSARTELTVGNVFFDVGTEGTTRVANHGGGSVEVSGRGSASSKSVTVREGMGTKVEKGRAPTPPEKLPPPPTWKGGNRAVLSLGGEAVTLSAAWNSVDEAAEYFVEVAADRHGIEVLKSAYVSADVTKLEVRDVPPGTYYATVSSIDADQFEGIPSERVELRVLPVEYDETARVGTEGPATFLLGTRLSTPEGVRCRVSDGEPERSVRLASPGPASLRCVTSEGASISPRRIRVATPEVEIGGPGVEEGRLQVRERGVAMVDLSFAPRAPEDLAVEVDGPDGVEMTVTPAPVTRERYRLKVAAHSGGGSEAELVLVAGDALELARVPVVIEPGPERSGVGSTDTGARRTSRRLRAISGLGGLARTGVGGTNWGGAGYVGVSYLHHRSFGLESAVGAEGLPGSGGAVDGRVRGLARFGQRDVHPYLAGGFGLRAAFDGGVAPFLAGAAGVTYAFDRRWAIRGEVGTDLASGAAGAVTWSPRASVGLLWRFP